MKNRIYPKIIAFLMTKQCTAQCKMCCFGCSSNTKEKMPLEWIDKIIEESTQIDTVETIGFSGGEPFLEYQSLISEIKHAKSVGKKAICTSNGFWGVTYDRALEIVSEIQEAGLDRLSLSVDQFHGEYVSVDKIKNILRASSEKSLPVDIGSVITKNRSKLARIFDELAEEMVNVPHYTAACLPVGNAYTQIDKSDLIYDDYIFSRANRCFETTYFAIFPNGDVYPCCSQAGATEPLKIGNVQEYTLEGLYRKYNSNINIRILKSEGLNWYLNLAEKIGYRKFFNEKYVNKCDLCRKIFSDKQFMNEINPYLEQEKEKIYAKYLETVRNDK